MFNGQKRAKIFCNSAGIIYYWEIVTSVPEEKVGLNNDESDIQRRQGISDLGKEETRESQL